QAMLEKVFPTKAMTRSLSKQYDIPYVRKRRFRAPLLHRYADDFIVLHASVKVVEQCKELISQWLSNLGLNLKDSKTCIAHTLGAQGYQAGFDFLGFNVRQYEKNDINTGIGYDGKRLGFKTLIKPSKEAVKRHVKRIGDIIRQNRSSPQKLLITKLSRVIVGWTKYYDSVVSSRIFHTIDYRMFSMLRRWAKYRSPKKSGKSVMAKYWWIDKVGKWVFGTPDMESKLYNHSNTSIKRVIRLKGDKSPYDRDWTYWTLRLANYSQVRKEVRILLKRQKGKCNGCGHYIHSTDVIEVDHIKPKAEGGSDLLQNKQLLHGHCHDKKTAEDFALQSSSLPQDKKLSGGAG
ncbi:MAG: group II intron maturase-specific domain-containing protein, partial [Cyanobacteria bacterium J06626_14]